MRKPTTLEIFLAMILGLASCSSKDEDQAYYEVTPPLAGDWFKVHNTRNVWFVDKDVSVDSDGDGDPANDKDVGIEMDGTGWGFYSTPGLKVLRGQDPRQEDPSVTPLDILIGVRHTTELEQIADAFPPGARTISNADWQNYLLPSLKAETQNEIAYFEASPNLLGTIVGRAVGPNGYWVLVDIANTAWLTGFSDTDGSTVEDYAGRPGLINGDVPVDMQQDIVDWGFTAQNKEQALNSVLSAKPSTLTAEPDDLNYDPYMVLPTGTIEPDLIFDYRINGKQVTVGFYFGQPKQEDAQTIAAFNTMLGGAYSPSSVLILQPGKTGWEHVKDWDLKHQDNVANNPP